MRTRSRLLFLGSMVLGVLLGLLVSNGLQRALSPSPRTPEAAPAAVQSRPAAARPDLDTEERHTIALFKDAPRSVAYITTQVEQVDFWTRNVIEVPAGTGSGFVWDDRGPRRHELPRRAGRRLGEGDARGRRVRREDRRLRARPGPRRAADRRAPREARPDRGGDERRPAGRPEGLRHRQPLRPRLHAHERHRERPRPHDPGRERRHDLRRHPDRRRDQPRQLRRAAARQRAAG